MTGAPKTLPALLLDRAALRPQARFVVVDGADVGLSELVARARCAAGGLRAHGVVAGRPVLLLLHDIEDFFAVFWGCLFAGGVPAAVAAPRDASTAEIERVLRTARVLGDPVVVVDRGFAELFVAHAGDAVVVDAGVVRAGAALDGVVDGGDVALVQFSSGSTRDPRGVVLTHDNLLANVAQMAAALPIDDGDTKLTWMPHFHDMGLIGGHLLPLHVGMKQVRIDAATAMGDPRRWLQAAASHQATILSSTCQGLARATRALLRDPQRPGFDLSRVRMIASGAEPLDVDVLRAFSRAAGLGDEVHFPLYGLAEATVGVSAPRRGGLRTTDVDGRARVLLGAPLPGVTVAFDDDGELLVKGPNVTRSYLHDDDATAGLVCGDGFIRTGDLARLVDGELVITGRKKDIVIVDGRKLHAHDVEAAAEAVAGVRAAVFVADGRAAPERPTLVVTLKDDAQSLVVLPAVSQATRAEIGASPALHTTTSIPRTTSGKKQRGVVRAQLERGDLEAPHHSALSLVRAAFAQALGRPDGDKDGVDNDGNVDDGVPFRLRGGTSLQAVQLLASIAARTGGLADHRGFARHSSARAFARHLERSVDDVVTAPASSDAVDAVPARLAPIAVIAVACRLPGARSASSFQRLLHSGETRIGVAPAGRDVDRAGAFLDDVDRFDAVAFGIAPHEAAAIDPQQRLFLTVAKEALDSAGLPDAQQEKDSDVGVFVGASHLAYFEHVLDRVTDDASALPPQTLAGNLLSMIAARVAHTLHLTGPALTVDTACSSSLVALHLACQSLRSGECSAAVVGGVHLSLTSTLGALFARAGALSPTGRCHPFAHDADGTVVGEGAVALVLAPLSRAEQNGWPVLGVVHGSAINNDGASLSIMAPNPAGQEAVLKRALTSANIEASEVKVVEAHGTATRVGDEVERAVLARVYPHGPRVVAVKGVVGHGLGAAGVTGLLRLLLELAPGERGAVSSFGFGGTNAHAIVSGGRGAAAGLDPPITGERHWLHRKQSGRRSSSSLPASPSAAWSLFALDAARVPSPWTPPSSSSSSSPSQRPLNIVITGASGALGSAVVARLSLSSARLLLVSRRARSTDRPDTATCVADVATAAGARAVHKAALACFGDDGVDVLVHLAGTLEPAAAAAVKRDALLRLESLEPRRVVLSSSIAACVPGLERGLEAYAAANRALDDEARSSLTPMTSLALPPLEGGMASAFSALLTARGLPRLSLAAAADVVVAACAFPASAPRHLLVLPPGILPASLASSSLSSVSSLKRAPSPLAAAPASSSTTQEILRRLVATALVKAAADVDVDLPLPALGLDSLAALDVVKQLEDELGRPLSQTLLYEHDTIAAAARAIDSEGPPVVVAAAPAAPAAAAAPAAVVVDGTELLPAQLAFVVQRRLFPDMPGNVLLAATVDDGGPALAAGELSRALAVLVARHPAMAMVVARGADGVFRQRPGPPPELRFVDDVVAVEDALADELFDLERGPLLRVITDGKRLLLDAHHAAVDAWSLRNVLLELLEVLGADRAHRAPDLPPLTSTLLEAMEAMRAAAPASSVDWYRQQLAGAPPLHLRWRQPVDAPSSGGGALARLVVDVEPTAALRAAAATAGVTVPAFVLAAWARALFDHSGQHDLVVRAAQGKRSARVADLERHVGAFADALPVRVQVEIDDDTAAVARKVSAFQRAAAQHAQVAALDLKDLPHPPAGPVGLSPVGFSFPLLPVTPRVGGFLLDDVIGRAAAGFTRATLVAFVVRGDDGERLHLCLNYARSHLSTADARALLESTAAHLRGSSSSSSTSSSTLHGRILARCRTHPERTAVVEGEHRLTYGALSRRSAALAARLVDVEGSRVAVFAAPGADAVVGLLSILRAGAAYVPLDPHWPDARVAQVLSTSRAAALVCTAELAARAQALRGAVALHVIDDAEREDGQHIDVDAGVDGSAAAYVMFTSGSTGQPKGVVVSHRSCLQFQAWVQRAFGVTDEDRFAQTSSLAFGGSVRQIFSALLAGASIHPVSREVLRDPDALVRFIADERITIWNSVPSLWLHLMDAADRATAADVAADVATDTIASRPFASVRCVLIGGEPVPASQVRRWRAQAPRTAGGDGSSVRLFDLYGSVETIVNATWFEVVRDPGPGEVHTPIGWSRAGTPTTLLDVNADGVGEIVVGGAIADGYFDGSRVDQTSFVTVPGLGRAYRTGDLARRLADGSLVHLGRKDSQVQVRGNRVELVEIEHTLAAHPAVRQAVVRYADERLIAAVELTTTTTTTTLELRAFCEARLPSFMVPHRIDLMASLPRTPAGKADRLHLRAADVVDAAPISDDASDVRAALARAWRAVLDLEQDPRDDDDFFARGGDSIRALEVLDQVRASIGDRARALRPMTLYRHRRFSSLAQTITAALVTTPASSNKAAPSSSSSRSAPRSTVSAVQRGFWQAQDKTGRCPTWAAAVDVDGALDVVALRAALAVVVERHEVLRTRFVRASHGLHGEVMPAVVPDLVVDDLRALDEETQQQRREAAFSAAASTSFDPAVPPLFSLSLLRTGERRHTLVLASHHIVSDAWSCFVLLGELLVVHDDVAAGRASSLAPLTMRFADVVAAEQAEAPSPHNEAFWRDTLAGCAQAAGPVVVDDVERRIALPAAVWQAVTATARASKTSPFAVVLARFADAIGAAIDSDDVVIATALASRSSSTDALSRVVGPLARALPLRLRAFDDKSVAAVVDDALAHEDIAARVLAAAAGPDGPDRLGRFFLSWLDPQAVPSSSTTSLQADWRHSRFRFAAASTRTEVMVGAVPHDDGLVLHLHGDRALVDVVAELLEARLRLLVKATSALVVYAPAGLSLPSSSSKHREPSGVIERVESRLGASDVVLLPLSAEQLAAPDLAEHVWRALSSTSAPVVALAGMLPSRLGLLVRGAPSTPLLTTGHAATVVAMLLTVRRALSALGASFNDARVAVVGYGSIGRATLALCEAELGPAASVVVVDPRLPNSKDSVDGADLILGASSGGASVDVDALAPGTLVVDDSFPRMFDDDSAWSRMRGRRDVLLVGGGLLDVGPLTRCSPFVGAAALRARWPSAWLPGCHAEAVLLAARPALGPTRGPVDVARARALLAVVHELGLTAPPLHLGAVLVDDDIVAAVASARRR